MIKRENLFIGSGPEGESKTQCGMHNVRLPSEGSGSNSGLAFDEIEVPFRIFGSFEARTAGAIIDSPPFKSAKMKAKSRNVFTDISSINLICLGRKP